MNSQSDISDTVIHAQEFFSFFHKQHLEYTFLLRLVHTDWQHIKFSRQGTHSATNCVNMMVYKPLRATNCLPLFMLYLRFMSNS